MVDQSTDDDWQGYPTGRTLLLGALFVAALYLSRHGAGVSSREWGYLLIGSAVLGFTAMDVKTGWALSFYRPVKRSEEPRTYWTSVVTSSTVGLAAVVYSVGALFGCWGV